MKASVHITSQLICAFVIVLLPLCAAATNVWEGDVSADWGTAGNWSDGHVPLAGEDVLIDSSATTTEAILSGSSAALASFTIRDATLIFTNWASTLTAADVTIGSGGVVRPHGPFTGTVLDKSNRVYVVCTDLLLAAGGKIDGDSRGFDQDAGEGAGATGAWAGGGGHGGAGGEGKSSSAHPGGAAYASVSAPLAPGSGGGSYQAAVPANRGGPGGGAVRIDASGTVTIDGTIAANGQDGGYAAAGGSGGSVYISCSTFGAASTALISADGGDGNISGVSGAGGGAGGRIAIDYGSLSGQPAVRLSTAPGSGQYPNDWDQHWYHCAEPGTLWLPDLALLSTTLDGNRFTEIRLVSPATQWSVDSLTISNSQIRFAMAGFEITVTNDLFIGSNGKLGIGDPSVPSGPARLTVKQDVVLTNGGALYVYAGATNGSTEYGASVAVTGDVSIAASSWIFPYAHVTNGATVLMTMDGLAIAGSGGINADGKGYDSDEGPGAGDTGTWGGGAGYGGRGGDAIHANSGKLGRGTYGSMSQPVAPGSGGGSYRRQYTNNRGGRGGGAVRIGARGAVTVDGNVTAHGSDADYASGAGSAGGVSISCSSFGGSGGMFAGDGGDASISGVTSAGAGGGGRVAVDYAALSGTPSLTFSVLPGYQLAFPTPGHRRAPKMGTLYFADTNLLSETLTAFDGFVAAPGFSSWSPYSLTVDGAAVGFEEGFQLDVAGDALVTGAGGALVMRANSELACGGDLIVTNGGAFLVYAGPTNGAPGAYGALVSVTGVLGVGSSSFVYPYTDMTDGGAALFRVDELNIAAGGGINAYATGFTNDTGTGKGGKGTWGGGAGHGGKGGKSSSGLAGGITYGLSNAPARPGSGGGTYRSNDAASQGGYGGGVVRIEVEGNARVEGTISADGEKGGWASGAGSGGAIFITCTNFAGGGAAAVTARGGNGSASGASSGGGGGGGRIAIGIGLSDGDVDDLLAGQPVGGLFLYEVDANFDGTLSATNGTGKYAAPSPDAAYPGSAFYMTVSRILTVEASPADYGSPAPYGYGSHASVPADMWVTNSVDRNVNEGGGLRRRLIRWKVEDAGGGPVASGTSTQAVFQFTETMGVTYYWTNQFELVATAAAHGSVNDGVVAGWYTNGVTVTNITATADPSYTFSQWTGDVPPGNKFDNPLSLLMDQARSVTANFSYDGSVTNVWQGGIGMWEDPTYWSQGGMPTYRDHVYIGSGTVIVDNAKEMISLTVSNGAAIVFSNWTTRITASNAVIESGGVMRAGEPFDESGPSNRVHLVCTDLVIEKGGLIDVDGRGYGSGSGPGAGGGPTGWAGGAGYGGEGGSGENNSIGEDGDPYGVASAPTAPGSGGGDYQVTVPANRGGPGGGAVRIEAGDVTLDGTISANGIDGGYAAGAGSGGGIYITCATFGGSNGVLRARGANGNSSGTSGSGGGSGGRIAVAYSSLAAEQSVRLDTSPGTGKFPDDWGARWQHAAEPGTVWLPDTAMLSSSIVDQQFVKARLSLPTNAWSVTSLTVSNASLRFVDEGFRLTVLSDLLLDGGELGVGARDGGTNPAVLAVGGNLTLTNGAALYLYSGATNAAGPGYGGRLTVTGDVTIAASSWIYPYSHTTNAGSVRLEMDNLAIGAGGGINADGKGYRADTGPGKGVIGTWGGAGGYGGRGGSGTGMEGGASYGSPSTPLAPGSGGGSYQAQWKMRRGGHGGGLVRVVAVGTVTVDGTISSDGGDGDYASAAGAGGGISIDCDTFGGGSSGLIRAHGALGHRSGVSWGGAGGGGRIALDYNSLAAEHSLRFSSRPGASETGPTPGHPWMPWMGTIYFPDTSLLGETIDRFDGTVMAPGFSSWSPASLTVANVQVGFADGFQLDVGGDLLVTGTNGGLAIGPGSTLTSSGNAALAGEASLFVHSSPTNGVPGDYGARVSVAGTLTVGPYCWVYPYSDTTNGGAPVFRMRNLTVGPYGGFNANGGGYATENGPAAGAGGAWGGGGGHGGKGGRGSAFPGGGSYGCSNAPALPGSGGGNYQDAIASSFGGPGGGVVRIEASGDVSISGSFTADGLDGKYAAAGGAGGSILIACQRISGGLISALTANGGDGTISGVNAGGGGGGGRIAVWTRVSNEADRQFIRAGGDLRRVTFSSTLADFNGNVDVDEGTGWRDPPDPDGAYPGTIMYLDLTPAAGTVFTLR